ncbi:MAG: UDP-3-O-acyl-N-acetylglucosamine deacetylase [Armatimonadota bacterium]|nr:UDP-3-O-acyl-N-acetylglucosamine deacetylase [Armatimonadota bacterium]
MLELTRATVKSAASAAGVGVRSGQDVTLTIGPAEIGAGLTVERADLGERWPLDLAHCAPGPGATVCGEGDAAVCFIEHLLAALWSRGITDCLVSLDGPEVPLFDGSALPLLEVIDEAGVARSGAPLEPLEVGEPAMVIDEHRALCALPGEPAEFAYSLEHDHPLIGRQFVSFVPERDDFEVEVAPARTFITLEEAEELREAGMLAAGSEENCLVVYPDHCSEEPAISQAFARHKLLDLLGDLYLLGRPVLGRIFAFYTGHRHNHELAHMLASEPGG